MSTMTEKESISLITQMIATSKGNLRENSFFYLLWGWLVLAASLSQYVLLQIDFLQAYLPWPILMTIGAISSVIYGMKLDRKSKVRTVLDLAMMYFWWGFLVLITLIIILSVVGRIPWQVTYPLIILLYGFGTFVSGGMLKFKPLLWGGVICLVIAIVAFFVKSEHVLLLTALSIILAYLIPGYLLKTKIK